MLFTESSLHQAKFRLGKHVVLKNLENVLNIVFALHILRDICRLDSNIQKKTVMVQPPLCELVDIFCLTVCFILIVSHCYVLIWLKLRKLNLFGDHQDAQSNNSETQIFLSHFPSTASKTTVNPWMLNNLHENSYTLPLAEWYRKNN